MGGARWQAWETSEWWGRACLHTAVSWGPRACSGRISAGLGVRGAPFSGVPSKVESGGKEGEEEED